MIVPTYYSLRMPPLGACGVFQQLYTLQSLAPQMLEQPMHPGQLNSNLPKLLVPTKSLLPRRIPKGQYNLLCQRLEILVRQEALDRICLPRRCTLSNCGCARLLAHSKYQVLHRRITHNKCFLRSWGITSHLTIFLRQPVVQTKSRLLRQISKG